MCARRRVGQSHEDAKLIYLQRVLCFVREAKRLLQHATTGSAAAPRVAVTPAAVAEGDAVRSEERELEKDEVVSEANRIMKHLAANQAQLSAATRNRAASPAPVSARKFPDDPGLSSLLLNVADIGKCSGYLCV